MVFIYLSKTFHYSSASRCDVAGALADFRLGALPRGCRAGAPDPHAAVPCEPRRRRCDARSILESRLESKL